MILWKRSIETQISLLPPTSGAGGSPTLFAPLGATFGVLQRLVHDGTLEQLFQRLGVGQTLAVAFGNINYSIGDQWAVVSDPDPNVVRPLFAQIEPARADTPIVDEEPMPPGSSATLTMRFVALAPGHTAVWFQYSYRGTPQDLDDGFAGTRTIAVTVD